DTLGHLGGDAMICALTDVIRTHIRESDVLCRWGGEELIILASDCTLDSALELAEKLRHAVEQAAFPDGQRLTVSAGIAEAVDGEDADGVLGRADDALYEAKDAGRNRVVAAQAEKRRRP
ncbi:MAG: GGDEF domain-containing protein, partial [Magnetospirillum sp.]